MKIFCAILILSVPFLAAGQQPSSARRLDPVAESRVQEIIKNLEPDSTLRLPLERGERGDGIHHAWMDRMRQFGIRQASFRVGFRWGSGVESLKVKNIALLRQYYRHDTRIKERKLLRSVRSSGLERELSDAILIRARDAVVQMMKHANRRRAHGTLYLNLLDDEALPVLDEMPDVN